MVQQLYNYISLAEIQEGINIWNKKPNLDSSICSEIKLDCYVEYNKPSIIFSNYNYNSNIFCNSCQSNYAMFIRAHTCRLCATSCCDDCSKKRITLADDNKVIYFNLYEYIFNNISINKI